MRRGKRAGTAARRGRRAPALRGAAAKLGPPLQKKPHPVEGAASAKFRRNLLLVLGEVAATILA